MEESSQANTQGSKHIWTKEEDEVLIACLLDLKNERKLIADNGFKSGYLTVLEDMMEKKSPGCGIKGVLHIQSRLKILKRDWTIVYDMVHGGNTSGFGWDNAKKCVTAEKDVWDTYIKAHKKAADFRNKELPHFEDLCIIFGKDRATGKDAQSAIDILEEIEAESTNHTLDGVEASMSSFQGQKSNTNEVTSSTKKRKRRHSEDSLAGILKDMAMSLESGLVKATEHLGQCMASIGTDAQLQDKRERIYSKIMKVKELSKEEKINASLKIPGDSALLRVFYQVPDEDKADWVRHVIG